MTSIAITHPALSPNRPVCSFRTGSVTETVSRSPLWLILGSWGEGEPPEEVAEPAAVGEVGQGEKVEEEDGPAAPPDKEEDAAAAALRGDVAAAMAAIAFCSCIARCISGGTVYCNLVVELPPPGTAWRAGGAE